MLGMALFAPKVAVVRRELLLSAVLMVAFLTQLLLRMWYWLNERWYKTVALEFFAMDYVFMFVGWRWLPLQHPGLRMGSAVGIALASYILVACGYQMLLDYLLKHLRSGADLAAAWFALFLVTTHAAKALLHSCAQRLVASIARQQHRCMEWGELLAAQVACVLIDFFQLTYYRMIFTDLQSLRMELLFIAGHGLMEVLLNLARIHPRACEWQRRLLTRMWSPAVSFFASPIFEPGCGSISTDLH
jgi:hypothetical protein